MKRNVSIALALVLTSLTLSAQAGGRGQVDLRPAAQTPSTLTRAQVQAEAAEAFKNGRIVRGEYVPNVVSTAAPMTRAQVVAEMLEHRRLGLTSNGKDYPQATPEQAEQIRQAGLRALQNADAASTGHTAVHQH